MPTDSANAMVFFDLGTTLASVTIAPTGDRIGRRDVYPDVPAEHVNQALAAAGIGDLGEDAAERAQAALADIARLVTAATWMAATR